MYPGPNLNMLIGPNGTGKSTVVAAIILGLGGNPKVVGRGSKVSEYVKHECDSAIINLYLQREDNGFIKVTRIFDLQDKTIWKLNNNRCSLRDVENCIKTFNIQVDNLCQFLPQDKVQDFAKLNKQELLKKTQMALCRHDLVTMHNNLITAREKHIELMRISDQQVQKIQDAQNENIRMEGRVENFKKKLMFKEKIAHIDRKIAWMIYEQVRIKLTGMKKDKITAQELCDKYKDDLKPMEREINTHKQTITSIQHKNSATSQKIRDAELSINSRIENIDLQYSKARDIKDEMNNKIAEIEQWDKEIEESVQKIEEMRKFQSIAAAKIKEDQDNDYIKNEMLKYGNRIRSLQDKKEEVEHNVRESIAELRSLENQQTQIENTKRQRLEQLKRISQDAYEGVLYLRNNKHLFKGETFEPIMLELNILDNSKSKYVEACIPVRDRLAFTCVEKEDTNLLIRCLRGEKGLSINVLHSGYTGERYNKPNVPIEKLRRFGFYTYVNSLFTAPEPVMRYLCKTYRLHNIPVGDENTNNCYEEVPKGVNLFFSDRFRYHINYSKYSGEKSATQTAIRADGGLSLSLDILRLERLRGRCNDLRKNAENFKAQMQQYDAQIDEMTRKVQVFRDQLGEVQKRKHQVQAMENKIQAARSRLDDMRKLKKDPDTIKREADLKIKRLAEMIASLQRALKTDLNKIALYAIETNQNSLKVETTRRKLEYLENEIVDSKRLLREAQETLNLVTDKYNTTMAEAKAQLNKAKELSNGCTPADDGFEEFREVFDGLSSNIDELNTEKENIKCRISCLNTADDGEMREYEERANLIESLQKDIGKCNAEMNSVLARIERMKEEWLTPLKAIISEINIRFSEAFARMGCAGEVEVYAGGNDMNFADYGLSIKVTYRNGEPLQELNSTVQSGGERAVATAAFMLSLQELTPVPFRCVDEINQGMDANNERRIFELVVETTCQPDTSQYFLITPKLVPNLRYPERLAVHIVHNGPFINPDTKWGRARLCNPQGETIQ